VASGGSIFRDKERLRRILWREESTIPMLTACAQGEASEKMTSGEFTFVDAVFGKRKPHLRFVYRQSYGEAILLRSPDLTDVCRFDLNRTKHSYWRFAGLV